MPNTNPLDSKISQLQSVTTWDGEELVLLVVDPNGTPSNKNITLNDIFKSISNNTTIDADLTVTGNVVFQNKNTPTSSNDANVPNGSIFYDDNYLYIRTSDNEIKRVELSNF